MGCFLGIGCSKPSEAKTEDTSVKVEKPCTATFVDTDNPDASVTKVVDCNLVDQTISE